MGIGKPERLKFDLNGFWSRHINRKDRFIYKIEEI
ncbi:type II toxin-antitoxin system YoeB family toxin [Pedobacter suwonensis]